ncbi:YicC/YloC family endoribonuclease [Pseudofulvimonas gallinarii]|jgi:uncharacterized protein (TIGR00255 family)|uniref:Uncharacterized protein (TIGR00255 family) n=1 Tax=Pseudofulvimonas gallinarii TaxID=634155 RepID=A0A4S3KXF4_9GAMM|nr:YicC/YloC family endoribonuclease [Pseudofulvimonas gallinarii]TCS96042.1 uncharacterized protein (TIGR00255 family) [Pseudofulvimonas gallinarii]THD13288.1 YicC family protein [Pseudofulvimonas gallinarii]
MIRSMTGFAEAERNTPWGTLTWELRSVNHRFLEVAPRLPEDLRALDGPVRERVAARVARGKVDVTLRIKRGQGDMKLVLNEPMVLALTQVVRRLGEHLPSTLQRLSLTDILAWPGVLAEPDTDQAALQAQALEVLDQAIDAFIAAREREGGRLAALLEERLVGIEYQVSVVRDLLPDIRKALRQKLEARLADLKQPLDPGRLEQEVVLSLSKLDVDEELDRLAGHVTEARRTLGLAEAVGRRLDFLMQEFNREANTLGSKSVDGRSTQAAVELKVLIEQMREQVQNIE